MLRRSQLRVRRLLAYSVQIDRECDPMDRSKIVHSNPEILGGTPVFFGTRVPVRTLLVYLEGGETLEEFLDNFPTVSREQAIAFLEESASSLLAQIA